MGKRSVKGGGRGRDRTVRSVSVPSALASRMEKVQRPVNWSALACQVWEAKLEEIEKESEREKMAPLIERLRESVRESRSAEFQRGWKAGREWVERDSPGPELQRLDSFANEVAQTRETWEQFFLTGETDVWGVEDRLYFTLDPEGQNCRVASQEFWERAVGEDVKLTDDFVRGFAEGALDVWDSVKDYL